jgi:hypothetical protein
MLLVMIGVSCKHAEAIGDVLYYSLFAARFEVFTAVTIRGLLGCDAV